MEEEYLISDLAAKAGVTVRTIRYYMSEGLLPAVITRGKYAHFTQEHLDRLELIRRLKVLRLPLEEIKMIIQSSKPEDIHRLLQFQDQLNPTWARMAARMPEEQPGKPGQAALDYIAHINVLHSTIREPVAAFTPPPPTEPDLMPADDLLPQEKEEPAPGDILLSQKIMEPTPAPADVLLFQGAPAPAPRRASAGTETWRRIRLAPGVELNVLTDAAPAVQQRIKQLVEFAQKLFGVHQGGTK